MHVIVIPTCFYTANNFNFQFHWLLFCEKQIENVWLIQLFSILCCCLWSWIKTEIWNVYSTNIYIETCSSIVCSSLSSITGKPHPCLHIWPLWCWRRKGRRKMFPHLFVKRAHSVIHNGGGASSLTDQPEMSLNKNPIGSSKRAP